MVVRAVKEGRVPTESERRLLVVCRDAAERMDFAPTTDDLAHAIGVSNGGTISEMLTRLHEMGEIELRSFQRGRQICFPDGTCTARPLNCAPHWRDRPRDIPTPSIGVVRDREPAISAMIFRRAHVLGKPAAEFLADLVYIGWEVEKERG